jgi:ammonia channel protein AmtB
MNSQNLRENGGKLSVVDFCSGAISGLVAITPGAGYVRGCES